MRYAVMPLLTAYWVMDLESMERGEEPVGLFNRALAFLALALRLGEGRSLSDRIRLFHVKLSPENTMDLKGISFTWNGEEEDLLQSSLLICSHCPDAELAFQTAPEREMVGIMQALSPE